MRVAMVTGAGSSRGIGRAVAEALGRAGFRVVLADRDGAGVLANAEQLAEIGLEAWGVTMDVSDPVAICSALEAVAERWGPVQVLVNNAGVTHSIDFLELRLEDWERLLRINLTGAFLCTQVAARQMVATGWGRIISITSISAQRGGGIFGGCHYTASKAGLVGFTQAIARELAPYGITCNCVSPGIVDTDITTDRRLLDRRQHFLPQIPVGRLGTAEDVAAAVAFLASDAAAYITGAVIDVNGGLHIH